MKQFKNKAIADLWQRISEMPKSTLSFTAEGEPLFDFEVNKNFLPQIGYMHNLNEDPEQAEFVAVSTELLHYFLSVIDEHEIVLA